MGFAIPANRVAFYLGHEQRIGMKQNETTQQAKQTAKRPRGNPDAKKAFRMLMLSKNIKAEELAKRIQNAYGLDVSRDIAELRGGRVELANIKKPAEYGAIFNELGTSIEAFDQAIKDARNSKTHSATPPDKEIQRLIEMVKVALDGPRRTFLKEAIKLTYSAAITAEEPR